jgi:hypothetical protein
MQDWELVPSSSFSDWKLEKNPVSGFLTLIKNLITSHSGNQVEFRVDRNIKKILICRRRRGGSGRAILVTEKRKKRRIFVLF